MKLEEEANYVNNQGVSEAIAKGIKVRTFMKRLVTKIGSKETGEAIMTGIVYMIGKLLQLALERYPWRT